MSGLCALALPSAAAVDSLAQFALGRMTHYPWLRAARHLPAPSSVALGVVTFDARVASALVVDQARQTTVAFDGEIYDADLERARLGAAGHEPADGSDAALLVAGWHAEGAAFLARLNGEFSAALWNGSRGQLCLITDRFGLRPLYMARPDGGCVAASEVNAVLAVPGVDESWSTIGVSQFFGFGFFFNDDTLLTGVRAVPASTVATFDVATGQYDEQQYWRPDGRRQAGSRRELTERFEDSFIRAVERRARPAEHLGLSLSGGLDARTILAAVPAGRDLKTVSLGIEGSLDHRSASAMAAIAGVPHRSLMLDADFLGQFEQHLREMVRLTSGHYLDQGIVMATMPVYRELGIDYLMRGHGGELLHMTKAYAFSLDASVLGLAEDDLEAWLFAHLTDYMLGGVPDDLFAIDVREGVRASLRRALARCVPVDVPVDRVWQLFINERLHRETALSMHTFGCFASIRQPFLDNDVIDALLGMPADMKLADELQTALLRRIKPAFLDVTNANTGARMGAGALETALAKVRLKVGAKLGLKGYQPYERLGLWLKRELRPLVESTVTSEGLLNSGLFQPDVVRRIVRQHLEGQANHTFLLMSLMVFALGMDRAEAVR